MSAIIFHIFGTIYYCSCTVFSRGKSWQSVCDPAKNCSIALWKKVISCPQLTVGISNISLPNCEGVRKLQFVEEGLVSSSHTVGHLSPFLSLRITVYIYISLFYQEGSRRNSACASKYWQHLPTLPAIKSDVLKCCTLLLYWKHTNCAYPINRVLDIVHTHQHYQLKN